MPLDIGTYVASVATAGGGGAVIALGITKAFGAKWMDSRFARQLEKSKQDHATETEHLRFKIAGLLDRASKLNQREFEVLPDIWAKADEAHHVTAALASRWREYPDFTNLTDPQFEAQLKSLDLEDWQKDEIRAGPKLERNSYFSQTVKINELHRANLASYEFSSALSKSSIYLQPETYERINAFAIMIFETVRDWKFDVESRMLGERVAREDSAVDRYRKDGSAAFEALGAYLRQRYWDNEAAIDLLQG